ncbi:MAG: class I SAM-dependent methyltransferase [Planctomycetaceae bacterium]
MTGDSHDPLLREQQAYYAARAPEYDQWWLRRGSYDCGEELNRRWFAEINELQSVVDRAEIHGEVLELAGGTGNWTVRLARRAERLTVLDGSAEMLTLNRARLEQTGWATKVEYRQADLFDWQPDRQYDAVFCGFFLSHVPLDRREEFLRKLAQSVRPGGTFAVVDSLAPSRPGSHDGPAAAAESEVVERRLADGRTFRIVKRFYPPNELRLLLAAHGLHAATGATATYFVHAVARRER